MTERRKPIPKTQKEISNDQINPYDKAIGNPNDASKITDPKNRANQLTFKGDTVKPFSVGIQDIDESIVYYFQNVIKPIVSQNGTQIPVPIIYGSPERWKAVQRDGYYRDKDDKIMAPLIMFKRDSIEKNYSIGNKLDANNPNNYAVFASKWSDKNSYDNFNILNNRVPQKSYHAVVIPDYITLNYSCMVYTYYIEQMNKIVESINYASEAYWGDPQRFKFRARIDSFTTNTTLNQGEERLVRTEFSLKLYGYIIPDTINKSLNALNKVPDKTKFIFSVETANTLEDTETTAKDKNKGGGYRTNTNARFLDQTPLGAFQGINNVDIASVITSGSFSNPYLQLYRGDDTIINVDLRTLIPYTSSYALTSISSSYALTASYANTSSYALNSIPPFPFSGDAVITGSLLVSGSGITGSLFGTSSWANNTITASYSTTALSSSYALTASYVLNAGTTTGSFTGSFTGSYAITASYALNALSSSYSLSSSYAATASYAQQSSDIILQVINQSGVQIDKGIVVRITGSNNSSDTPRIGVADWTNDTLSANTLGLVTSDIPNGGTGYVMTEGLFKGYDTSLFQTGQVVYLGSSGSITGSSPQAPLHSVRLGQVTRTQQINGAIYVRIDNGYELDELHDVKITNATTGDLLIRSGSVWINSNQLTGSYSITGSLTISGSLTTNDGVYVQIITASFISASSGITGSLFGTSSWSNNSLNAKAIDISSFGSDVDSYLLMSNVIATTGIGVGGDTELRYNASTNKLSVGSVSATSLTGSLQGTSSWASNAVTASYVLQAVSASFSSTASFLPIATYNITSRWAVSASRAITSSNAVTASYVLNAVSSSFATTASYSSNGGVTQIVAGTNITISPTNGLGAVTINSTGGGGSGAGANITASFTNQSTWTFTHALNNRGVVVQTYDTNWNQTIPQNITLTDSNTATITFPTIESGYAIATLGGVTNNAASASFASTASFVNILNQDVLITGSLTVGSSSIGPSENTITLGARNTVDEGGQIGFNAPGGSYTSASFIDVYQDSLRILKGTNAGSTTQYAAVNLQTGNMTLNAGSIIMPTRPAFRVTGSTGYAPTSGTVISGSSVYVDYNQGSYYNNTNGQFTCPLAGLYHVWYNGRTQNASLASVTIYKNNSVVLAWWESNTNTGHFGVSSVVNLAANDVVTAKVSAGTVTFDGNDNWGVAYIG